MIGPLADGRESRHLIVAVPACDAWTTGSNAIRRAQVLSRHCQVTMISDAFPREFPEGLGRIRVTPRSFNYLRRLCHVPNEISFAMSVRTAIENVSRERAVSFVLCHGYALAYFVGRYLKRRHGIRFGMFMHGHIFERPEGTYDPRVTAFYRFIAPVCYREADVVLALSPDQARLARARGACVILAPNGVRREDIGLGPLHRVRWLDGDAGSQLRLLYVGRFSVEKGVRILLDACGILRKRNVPFRLRLIGPDPRVEETKAYITGVDIEDRVEILGRLPRLELGGQYRDADVLCVPSISEPLGNVVLEGLAAGCLVVASNVGGIPYVIEHGVNGWLVAPGDAEGFADAIELFDRDRAMGNRLKSRAGASVQERFDWDGIGKGIYQHIARQTSA